MKGRSWGGLEASARPKLARVEGLGGVRSEINQQGGGRGCKGDQRLLALGASLVGCLRRGERVGALSSTRVGLV